MTTIAHRSQTMDVRVNGERLATRAGTLAELVDELGHGDAKVATARNGAFVAERLRAATRLEAGDEIEIVSPRQGG
ncbi:MAG: sulfur carrier protein ThiS [Hyphomicrobiaceae bacterium]|jgi:sulfur carrier protein